MEPTDEIKARLNELGVEYDTYDLPNGEHGVSWIDGNNIEWEAVQRGENFEIHALQLVTPEQAIAATVGVTEDEADARDLMEAIRDDDGVRYSMDEVMDIMRKDVAVKVGNAREPSDAVIERIERFCTDYAQCLMDSTILVKRNYESMDRRAVEKAEAVEDRLIRELAEYIATFGRSCASCPEIDNPDSYINHMQAALNWHDEHVPRPTNPRSTCVVLKGQNPPEEVLFVRDEGGVTHYLPEGTCHMKLLENMHTSAYQDMYECDECGEQVLRETYMGKSEPPKFCPNCGRRVTKEESE